MKINSKNKSLGFFLALILSFGFAGQVLADVGNLDTDFSTNIGTGFNANVEDVGIQSTGKIIVVGSLTTIDGDTSNYIARLNSDGTPDTTFTTNIGTGFNAYQEAIGIQSDDKIVVVGTATTIDGDTSNYIARLNSDGTPDTTFTTNIGTGFNSVNYSVKIQSDDKILVGGNFTTIDGATSQRFARLNSDGTPDTTFNTNIGTSFNGNVNAIAIQSDGKIVVGGEFTSSSTYIARINSDGTLDTTFNTNTGSGYDDYVFSLGVQSDGKIVVGGYYTDLDGNAVNNISRLNTDGTPDTTFITNVGTGTNEEVDAVWIQDDDKIILGGYFTDFDGTTTNYLTRLNSDGTLDTTFATNIGDGFNERVINFALQDNGNIVVGGEFTEFDGTGSARIARLEGDVVVTTPTTTTQSATSITTTTATLNGTITDTGGEDNTTRGFDIGTDTSYTLTDITESGTYSTGAFSLSATGLTCGTQYHYRAYSTNSEGTGTGSDTTFTTSACPSTTTSGSSAGSRARNLISMGKVDEAQQVIDQYPNAINELQNTSVPPTVTPPTPNKVNTQSITSRLSKGTNNTQVQTLQEFLNTLGYNLKLDGKFGPQTEQVVKIFQASKNLTPDGIVGPITRGVMNGL